MQKILNYYENYDEEFQAYMESYCQTREDPDIIGAGGRILWIGRKL